MASPSVMEKVVFLLEAAEGMADHTEERCFVRSERRAS